MTHHAVEARDGRRLGITGLGEPAATRAAVLCHTAPGSSDFDPDPIATERSGLHIVAIDRPGYGASDRYQGEPQLDQWIGDVADYLDGIAPRSEHSSGVEVDVVGAIGIGYGCFYAAALAVADPGRIRRLALVAPPVPMHRSDPPWDPALTVDRPIDPMSGLLDRRQSAIDAADGYGIGADQILLADPGWGARVRHAATAEAVVFVGDSPEDAAAARWWHRHLHGAAIRHGTGTGVAMVRDAWGEALAHLADRPA